MTGWSLNRPAGRNRGLLVSAVLVFTAGCGQQPYGEVTGVVTRDGRPLPNVEVRFLPDPEKGTVGRHSAARTDAQGQYRLVASDARRDGAPVGFHRVCVHDLLADDPFGGGAPRVVEPGGAELAGVSPLDQPSPRARRSRVPPEYQTADRTPLRDIEVKGGSQVIDLEIRHER